MNEAITTAGSPTPTATPKQRILWVSRVLWDQVIVPWVLRPDTVPYGAAVDPEVVSCVLRVGEAAFPLVALCCRAVAPRPDAPMRGLYRTTVEVSEHYRAIEDAAAANCPRCVAWIIAHNNNKDDAGAEPEAGGSGSRRRRRKAKEQIAVMVGLCRGGHLGTVKAFVGRGGGCECWVGQEEANRGEGGEEGCDEVRNGGAEPRQRNVFRLWPTLSTLSSAGDTEEAVVPLGASPLWNSMATATGMGKEPILSEEFWSERGIIRLMTEVCSKGNLDVLKWIVSSFFQINEGNKFMLNPFVHEASANGQIDVIKWLVETFNPVHSDENGADFEPRYSVYDVKRFVESFPEWDFDGGARLACSTVTFQGPSSANEIIEVCQWLTDRFSLTRGNFTDWMWDKPPKHPEVLKWLISDATEESDYLQTIWHHCSSLDDVELSKCFVEKGIKLTAYDFTRAVYSKSDNLAYVEWLYKQVSVSSAELLSCLHTAVICQNEANFKWLEQIYTKTTNSRPKLSLVKLTDSCYHTGEGWIDWVLAHSGTSSVDCSEPELAKLVKISHPVTVALSAWKKFSLSPKTHNDSLLQLLKAVIEHGYLSQVKQVVAFADFRPSEIASCLCDVHQSHSSKIVKWLVTEYTRNISDPTVMTAKKNSGNMARLFAALIRLNKRGCLKWLFDRFHFTLPEVLVEVQAAKEHLGLKVDFATWKLLVRLFPEINRDDVTEHFMDVVTASPLHSQFSINRLGVTLDDIDQFCQESACENEYDELDDTRHWLDWTTCNHP